jgi:hypothetical protein
VPSRVVRWTFTPATTRSLRLLAYASVGLTFGPLVGFVGLVLTTLIGRDDAALLVLVAALVAGFGVGSGRVVFALAGSGATKRAGVRALSRRWIVVSVLGGAGIGIWSVLRVEGGFWLLVGSVGTGLAALVVGAGLRSEGEVDHDARTVSYGDGSHVIPLDAVRRVRSVQVGRFVLAWCRYGSGVGPSTPRVLVCSEAGLAAIEAAATTPPDAPDTDGTEGASRGPPAVRAVAATLGLVCIIAGPILWVVLPAGGGHLLAGYLGLFGLLFGALFLRYAVVA